MLVCKCRMYCLDNSENKVIFRILDVHEVDSTRHYSMFCMTPNTNEFMLFIQNPCFRAFVNRLYYMDRDIKIINYLGRIGDAYYEVIPHEYGSVLPLSKGEDVRHLYIEFINAGITIIPGKVQEKVLSRIQKFNPLILEIDSMNQYLNMMGNSNPISNIDTEHYMRFRSSDCGHKISTIGSIIASIDINGGLYCET